MIITNTTFLLVLKQKLSIDYTPQQIVSQRVGCHLNKFLSQMWGIITEKNYTSLLFFYIQC